MSMIDIDRESFSRDYGCTPAEWLGWMPRATQGLRWHLIDEAGRVLSPPARAPDIGCLQIDFPAQTAEPNTGQLRIRWAVQEPRRIALVVLPRLRVEFQFEGVSLERRLPFMRTFDLHLQRGGG